MSNVQNSDIGMTRSKITLIGAVRRTRTWKNVACASSHRPTADPKPQHQAARRKPKSSGKRLLKRTPHAAMVCTFLQNQRKSSLQLYTNKPACISPQREHACSLPFASSVSNHGKATCNSLPPNLSDQHSVDVNVIPPSPVGAAQHLHDPGCRSRCKPAFTSTRFSFRTSIAFGGARC